MTFDEDGGLRISTRLPEQILVAWGMNSSIASKALTLDQRRYMAYHRSEVFLG